MRVAESTSPESNRVSTVMGLTPAVPDYSQDTVHDTAKDELRPARTTSHGIRVLELFSSKMLICDETVDLIGAFANKSRWQPASPAPFLGKQRATLTCMSELRDVNLHLD